MGRVIASVCALGLVSCGGAIKAPPPPLTTETETEAVLPPRRPYAELMPAPRAVPVAPGVWVQLGGPAGSLKKLPTLAQELPIVQPVHRLDSQASSPYGPAVAAVIDLSQPVDVALDGPAPSIFELEPTWSFRVRSPEAVLRGTAGLTLQRVSAGVWEISLPPPAVEPAPELDPDDAEAEEYEDDDEAVRALASACQLRHLPEPVGYRVICGSSLERVNRDAPFLTAPERTQAGALDLRAELGGQEYRKLTEQRRSYFDVASSVPVDSTERAAVKMMADVGAALLQHDQIALEVELKGERLLAQVELRFQPQVDSPLLGGWLEQSSRAALPPSCARLPRDGAFAACFSGVGEEPARRFVDQVTASLNEDLQLKARDYAEISAAFGGIVPPAGRFSVACGVDAEQALRALTAPTVASADEAERALPVGAVTSLNEALGGWCTFGFDTPPDAYLAAAQRAFRADKIKAPKKVPDPNPRAHSTLKPGSVPAGLPAKTLHYVSQTRPDPKYKPRGVLSPPALPYDMHLLLVPEGDRVWVVASRSEKLAVARAKALLSAREPRPSWPELEAFAGKPGLAFLAIDFVGVDTLDIDWDSAHQRASARAKLQNVIVTSGRPRNVVPLWLDVVARRGGPGHSLRLRTDFPLLRVLGDLAVEAAGGD